MRISMTNHVDWEADDEAEGPKSGSRLKNRYRFTFNVSLSAPKVKAKAWRSRSTCKCEPNKKEKKDHDDPKLNEAQNNTVPDNHVCYGCGKVRSDEFHEQYPLEAGKEPVPSLCTGCRHNWKARIAAGTTDDISSREAQIDKWQWCANCGNLRLDEYHELYLSNKNFPPWAEVCGKCMIIEKGKKKTAKLRSLLDEQIDDNNKGHKHGPLRRRSRRHNLKPGSSHTKGKSTSLPPSAGLSKKADESTENKIQGEQRHVVSGIHEAAHMEFSNVHNERAKRPHAQRSFRKVTCETDSSDEEWKARKKAQRKARKAASSTNSDSQIERALRRLGELRDHLHPPQKQNSHPSSSTSAPRTLDHDHQPESERTLPQEGQNKPSSPKVVTSGTYRAPDLSQDHLQAEAEAEVEAELCYSAHASDAEVIDPFRDNPCVSDTFVWAPAPPPSPPSHSAMTPRRHSTGGSAGGDEYVPCYSHRSPIDGSRVWEVDSDEEREIERKRALFLLGLGLHCDRDSERGKASPSSD